VDQLRGIIAPFMNEATNLSAKVDTKSITISPDGTAVGSPYRVMSPVFSFTLPSDTDNVFTNIGAVGSFPKGTHSPMVGDGFYVMLAPLSAGQHTVHFHGEVPSIPFVLDINYVLNVQ
jgi:hypothetical protein